MNDAIARHCEELNRCNQRGGRMLSVFDLLSAETLDFDLAAYLMARISRGASFMVGAVPGGAGKTTVMCALLNFVPADVSLIAATAETVYGAAGGKASRRNCYVCHEIGSGSYFAYLWSDALRTYCGLSEQSHTLATNLHADDVDEARDQVCGTNGVPIALFNRFELLIFLRVRGGYFDARRRIELVYSSDGLSEHELAFTCATDGGASPTLHADAEYVTACRDFLCEEAARAKTIEQTRQCVLEFLGSHPS
ncbi:MAG: hypothetical protein ACYSWQ_28745 [Planctomycetota bacterium]|jgi:hypothetical protein